ncbi:MAG: hypothetical protein BWY91_02088 [bacterium ADurb.BinA028]|nr:MAG: hypothetical protein BWY91_02088 [bacterium ADurb.BinA028]
MPALGVCRERAPRQPDGDDPALPVDVVLPLLSEIGEALHARTAEVRGTPGRFLTDERGEASRDSREVHRLNRDVRHEQQWGGPLGAHHRQDEFVELGGALDGQAQATGLQLPFGLDLGLVVGEGNPVGADDRHVDDVLDVGLDRRLREVGGRADVASSPRGRQVHHGVDAVEGSFETLAPFQIPGRQPWPGAATEHPHVVAGGLQ